MAFVFHLGNCELNCTLSICKPLEKEDIQYLVDKVGYSASLAVNAGADGFVWATAKKRVYRLIDRNRHVDRPFHRAEKRL